MSSARPRREPRSPPLHFFEESVVDFTTSQFFLWSGLCFTPTWVDTEAAQDESNTKGANTRLLCLVPSDRLG